MEKTTPYCGPRLQEHLDQFAAGLSTDNEIQTQTAIAFFQSAAGRAALTQRGLDELAIALKEGSGRLTSHQAFLDQQIGIAGQALAALTQLLKRDERQKLSASVHSETPPASELLCPSSSGASSPSSVF